MARPADPAVGIDLGTTKSSVAVFRNSQVEIIPNNLGNKMTPSCVSFTSTHRLIGQAAKDMIAENSSNTVYDNKRLIGRRYGEPVVQSDMNHWPFKVIQHDQSIHPYNLFLMLHFLIFTSLSFTIRQTKSSSGLQRGDKVILPRRINGHDSAQNERDS